MEHFSNCEEPNALEMTNVVKSVTSFLNAHNDRCYKGAFIGRPKIKGHNFLPSFRLYDQGETKLKPAV